MRQASSKGKAESKKAESRPHDPVYRRIFTHRSIIEEILRRFVVGPWTSKLDFSTLELVPPHYVSRFLDQRESDVIWRVRYGLGEHEWFYVYVLMELQSSVSRFMALRLWTYVALLYQFLIKDQKLTSKRLLPPVLPVVLYNGEKPWWAPRSLAGLIQPLEGLAVPSFEYVVLDVGHYPVEELRPVADVTSGVFLLEQVSSVAELEVVVDEVMGLVDDPEVETDIALLISSIAGKLAPKDEKVPRFRTLQEAKNMVHERVAKWPKEWLKQGRQEGMQKGMQEGMQKGMRQGKAELLKAQASHRFGELPVWAVERFDRADVDTLDRWSHRLLDARRLEDVFDDPD
ncbi:MAG TPA: Rpn family recombination-promoting nuclease/putative transposase [Thermoanaerobaculia bacterium]|jgi:predicted transposase YdaD